MCCKFCRGQMFDLTHDFGAGRHYLCNRCRAHYYHPIKSFLSNEYHDAKWFTAQEWKKYIDAPMENGQKMADPT